MATKKDAADALYKEIEAKADELRKGNLREADVAAAFDEIVGQLDDETPLEHDVVVRDRNVEQEMLNLVNQLGQTAKKATLQTDREMDHAIDYMLKDDRDFEDGLKELDNLDLKR